MLVDADILIWYLRGYRKAAQFLSRLAGLKLSAVAYIELVQGMRDKAELSRLGKDLEQRKATILPITEAISRRAVGLVEAHFLPDGLRLADALIAATAIDHQLTLATANTRHYRAIQNLTLEVFTP